MMGSPKVSAHYTRTVHLEVTLTKEQAHALRLLAERVRPQLDRMAGGLVIEASAALALVIAALDDRGITTT